MELQPVPIRYIIDNERLMCAFPVVMGFLLAVENQFGNANQDNRVDNYQKYE